MKIPKSKLKQAARQARKAGKGTSPSKKPERTYVKGVSKPKRRITYKHEIGDLVMWSKRYCGVIVKVSIDYEEKYCSLFTADGLIENIHVKNCRILS